MPPSLKQRICAYKLNCPLRKRMYGNMSVCLICGCLGRQKGKGFFDRLYRIFYKLKHY